MALLDKLKRDLSSHALPEGPGAEGVVTAADLADLPESVRRYLAFMGVEGKRREWSFRIAWSGRFRTRPSQGFMRCQAWQYNTNVEIARIFLIQASFFGFVPVLARDTFVNGRGRMLVRLLDRVTVEDARGRELDIGELITYVNDALLLCPSMLLCDAVRWTHVVDDRFDVSLKHGPQEVTGRVSIDGRGAITDFSTTDRFCAHPSQPKAGLIRTRWSTPIEDWSHHNGRPFPTYGRAVWHLPEGEFTYAELVARPETFESNTGP